MTGALLTIILSVGFIATSRYVEGQNQYFSHYDFLKTIEGLSHPSLGRHYL
ncbi:Uncharacterised protein [Raoultella planticola]|uniref:Uncharacterized protein n=1 Tax=Raoultella planticola TaxID=575 RepID=A0A485D200_RAOPL|nr:Uncharacterised protein [Raoultella planticola]